MRSIVVFELFDTGPRPALRLVDAKASPSGVITTYHQESG
jgi:hypothetical protein